jgi:drug/metabolite transporter (DMT)-like permease
VLVATFVCYGTMMFVSYIWGQKEYPIPYAWKKLIAYIITAVIIYLIHYAAIQWLQGFWYKMVLATLLFIVYSLFIFMLEKKELKQLPYLGKLIK